MRCGDRAMCLTSDAIAVRAPVIKGRVRHLCFVIPHVGLNDADDDPSGWKPFDIPCRSAVAMAGRKDGRVERGVPA